jgi:hypothetical protein
MPLLRVKSDQRLTSYPLHTQYRPDLGNPSRFSNPCGDSVRFHASKTLAFRNDLVKSGRILGKDLNELNHDLLFSSNASGQNFEAAILFIIVKR